MASLYEEAKAGLSSLFQQTAIVSVVFLITLLITRGDLSSYLVLLNFGTSIVLVAFNEKNRLTKLRKPTQSNIDTRRSIFSFRQSSRPRKFAYANLSGIDLSGSDLSGFNFRGANLNRTNLSRANLSRANLKDANLEGANLSRTNLKGANLEGANLSHTNLEGANLEGANLRKAKNLTSEQVKVADSWDKAKYNAEFYKQLGLPNN
jgi:uncharacterized protein YjbI with pentapeptide repeats